MSASERLIERVQNGQIEERARETHQERIVSWVCCCLGDLDLCDRTLKEEREHAECFLTIVPVMNVFMFEMTHHSDSESAQPSESPVFVKLHQTR